MKLFLDSSNADSIQKWNKTGIINGVTTNPTNVVKEGGNPIQTIKNVLAVMPDKDVSIEITETDPEKVYAQAKRIAQLGNNVVVKIPCHIDYYSVITKLVSEGVQINITLLFTVMQGLHMCKLGVKYISPFVARSDDIAMDGILLLQELRAMIDQYHFSTQILAASIRTVDHYHNAIISGVDVTTMSDKVIKKAVEHPLTDKGMDQFIDDWKKLGDIPFV